MKYIKPEHCLNHRLAIILMKLDIMDYKRWIITEAKSTESNSSKIQYYFFFWMFMINCISFTTLYLGLKNEEKKNSNVSKYILFQRFFGYLMSRMSSIQQEDWLPLHCHCNTRSTLKELFPGKWRGQCWKLTTLTIYTMLFLFCEGSLKMFIPQELIHLYNYGQQSKGIFT